MTAPIQPTPIDLLPVGPRPTDTVEQFDAKSFATIEAQEAMVPQINAAIAATYQNAVATDERAVAADASKTAAAASADTANTQANRSRDEANRSEAGAVSSWNAAAVAGAEAGLPIFAGKEGLALVVNRDGTGVEWNSVGFEVGGVYAGAVKPSLGVWIETDAVYYQAAYPALFAALGLVPAPAPWTQRTPAALTAVNGLAYGNGMYVAVGANASSAVVAASSPDGITWTARVNNAGNSVAFGAGVFVSVTTGGVRTSSDGITWAVGTIPAGSWASVVYGGGLFVATGSGIIATSPDGITWTSRSGGAASGRSATYGAGRFVILSQSTAGGGVTSTDGINWTAITTPANIIPFGLSYGNGLFVGVGTFGAVTSPDGITWTARPMPGAGVGGAGYTSGAFYNGRFVAVGSSAAGNPLFADSPDGATWTARFMPAGGYSALLVANGLIVAAGSVMQTAPMFPYNTATQFYVPAPLGVVGLDSWIKVSDGGGQGGGSQDDYLIRVIGTDADQVSANGMLGRQAFMDTAGEITPMQSQPVTNGAVWFEAASNTSLRVLMRGTDGIVRSATLTLA